MKRGFALITVLAVLMLIALGTATILQSVGTHTSLKAKNVQEVKAQDLAEAGMQHALQICRKNNGDCSLANITLLKADTLLEQDIKITTVPATSGAASYTIKVEVNYPDV
ncbi:MAG: hypothetical protein WC133_02880 [Candidatus Omnitrophota bacterium]